MGYNGDNKLLIKHLLSLFFTLIQHYLVLIFPNKSMYDEPLKGVSWLTLTLHDKMPSIRQPNPSP